VGTNASVKDNFQRFLKILRRESRHMAIIMPRDPAVKSAKYNYLYQLVFRKTRVKGNSFYDDSVDESNTSEETYALVEGGPSSSAQKSKISPTKIQDSQQTIVDNANSSYQILGKDDEKMLFDVPASSLSERPALEMSMMSQSMTGSPLQISSLVEDSQIKSSQPARCS